MIKYLKYQPNVKKSEILLPVRISYLPLKRMKEELGRDFDEQEGTDHEAYECLLFHSLVQGFKKVGESMPFKKEEMEEVMDEVFAEFMTLTPEFMTDEVVDPPVKKGKGGAVKKQKPS